MQGWLNFFVFKRRTAYEMRISAWSSDVCSSDLGGGFLGRYVVQRLLARGARVRVAQREPRAATFLKPLGGLGQTQFVVCDVRDPGSVARAVQGSDAVINLAGAFGDMQAVQADGEIGRAHV